MRFQYSKICAFILALAMLPGVSELLENTGHLVAEGHLAHAAPAGDQHDPADREHGCTATLHLCGCHANLASLAPQSPIRIDPGTSGTPKPMPAESSPTGFRPPIERPPQA